MAMYHLIGLVGIGVGWIFYSEISQALRIAAQGIPAVAQVLDVEDLSYSDAGSVRIWVSYFALYASDSTVFLQEKMFFAALNLSDYDDPCPPGHDDLCLAPGDEVRILYDPGDPGRRFSMRRGGVSSPAPSTCSASSSPQRSRWGAIPCSYTTA
ncbi:MAG: hypothetical protein OHK0039_24980 [Bacteroidia bacterium]